MYPINCATPNRNRAIEAAMLETLAHELAHVTQQTGARQASAQSAPVGGADIFESMDARLAQIESKLNEPSTLVQAPARKRRKKGGLFSKIKKGFKAVTKGIGGTLKKGFSALGGVAKSLTGLASKAIGGLAGIVQKGLGGILSTALPMLGNLIGPIAQPLKSVISRVRELLDGGLKSVVSGLTGGVQSIASGLGGLVSRLF